MSGINVFEDLNDPELIETILQIIKNYDPEADELTSEDKAFIANQTNSRQLNSNRYAESRQTINIAPEKGSAFHMRLAM